MARVDSRGRFRGLSRKHPLVQLKIEIAEAFAAKKIPRIVLRQIWHVFQSVPADVRDWDADYAQDEAQRIGAHVHWLRANHELLRLNPTERAFLTASKATSLWMNLRVKLNNERKMRGKKGSERRSVPVPRAAPPASATEDDEEPL